MECIKRLLGIKPKKKPTPARKKFRFLARFNTQLEEEEYYRWTNDNDVEDYFHQSDIDSWPRDCKITVLASWEKIKIIKTSSWYTAVWKTDVSRLNTL